MTESKAKKDRDHISFEVDRALKENFEGACRRRRQKMTPILLELMDGFIRSMSETASKEPLPLDALEIEDLDRHQRDLLRMALVAIRRPSLNWKTEDLVTLLKSALREHLEDKTYMEGRDKR